MKFPETTRVGDDAHVEAVERLDAARDVRRQRRDAHAGSRGTPWEERAAAALNEAEDRFAAREAWVKWIERGY
jgi:hypothetical protein